MKDLNIRFCKKVNFMVRKRKFAKHFDLAHSLMFSAYPSQYTKALGVPGEFVKKLIKEFI